MADKQIIIHISSIDNGGAYANKSITTGNNASGQTSQKPNQAGEQSEENQIVATVIVNEAKKVMSTAISQYSNITGNSIAANRINAFSTVTAYATAIKAGGAIGAIYVATDIALKETQKIINNAKTNAQINLLRQRVGYSNVNGSRGTND